MRTVQAVEIRATLVAIQREQASAEFYSFLRKALLGGLCVGAFMMVWVAIREIARQWRIKSAQVDLQNGNKLLVQILNDGSFHIVKEELIMDAGAIYDTRQTPLLMTEQTYREIATGAMQSRVLTQVADKAAGGEISERISQIAVQTPLPVAGQPGRDGYPGQPGRDAGGMTQFSVQGASGAVTRCDYQSLCGLSRQSIHEFCSVANERGLSRNYWLTHQFERGERLTRDGYDKLMAHAERLQLVAKNQQSGAWQIAPNIDARKMRNRLLSN